MTSMKTRFMFGVLTLAAATTSVAQAPVVSTRALMPVPRLVAWSGGRLRLDSTFGARVAGFRDARLDRAVRRALVRLAGRTALRLPAIITENAGAPFVVRVQGAGMAVQGIEEDESYTLDVGSGVTLDAPTVVGAIRGLETLLQLIESDAGGFYLPHVHIEDTPRFRWRGINVDVSRHFMPVAVIERTLDGMAAVKLNVLHWHLSDDQGFRAESRRYPRLTGLGSDGLFYTQDDIRHVVAYARDRGIRVVPEFDMPGHTQSWLVGYPQYAAGPGPFPIERRFGVFDPVFDPTNEALYTFLAGFVAEMAPLFPDAYWHVGGDEVNGVQWNASAAITAFKRRRGFADNEALQAYFNQRMLRILSRHGKQMIGWDEILHPDLPTSAVIQSWRGTNFLATAATRGYSGILSAPYYLDHQTTAAWLYSQDPLPASTTLTPEQQARVLGGEACMWAEHVSAETVDSRIWPRVVAVAERLWSPRELADTADMYRRLRITSRRLEELGLTHEGHTARMLRRLAGDKADMVAPFFELVQTPDFGQRSSLQRTDQLVPLTQAVDAARPDPPARFDTELLAGQALSGDSVAIGRLTATFLAWIYAAHQAREAAPGASWVPAAATLDSVARLGLSVMAWERPPAESTAAALAALQRWEQPRGLLRVWGTETVKRLVQARSR